jgi:tetratricopeptide (TPR) repeat protein
MVFYLDHKYPQAEGSLAKALQYDPSLASARVLLGATLGREGKAKPAIAELDRALKSPLSESAERTARMALYQALFARADYGRALEALKPLVAKYPNDVEVLYGLGQIYLQLASKSFERIATVSPQSYRVHQILGDSLAQQDKYQEAIREYRQALEAKPDLPGVHYKIGLLYRMFENTPAGDTVALQEFESELRLNPYDAWAEYRLGRIFLKQQQTEDAISHLQRAVELDETIVPARLLLARALEVRGDLEEATKQLEAAGKIEPDNPTVHYRLANLFKKTRNLAASEEEMKKFEAIQAAKPGSRQELEKAMRRGVVPQLDEPPDADE